MSLTFQKKETTTLFEKVSMARLFSSSKPEYGARGAVNPIDPTIDPRLTRIPVYTWWSATRTPGTAPYIAPITAFDWMWPDGSLHNETTLTYNPLQGAGEEVCYAVLKTGKSWSDITYINYIPYNIARVNTEDLFYAKAILDSYSNSGIYGDIAHVNSLVTSLTATLLWQDYGNLYGDVGYWDSLKVLNVYLYSMTRVHGALKFVANAVTKVVSLLSSTGFSPADVSQTLVNWNACNSATFARTGNFSMYKRSQLTTAGEAAVVSLIAKGAAFTFKAE